MAWAVNRPAAGTAYSLPTRLFPTNNWWNLDISAAPVDPNSDTYILGTPALFPANTNDYNYRGFGVGPNYTSTLRTNWGNNYGMPWCTVSGDYPTIVFDHISYSGGASGDDARGYPIPVEALTVPGWTEDLAGTIDVPVATGDRHLLIFDVDNQYLYEIYQPYHNATASPVSYRGFTVLPGEYACASCSFWDTKTNNVRPLDVTSSDAAGLQVLPGLVTYDEIMGTAPITHAHRMCVAYHSYEQPRKVWPATHETLSTLRGMPPLGARLRLKASFDMSVFASSYYDQFRKLAVSLKTYGVIVTDNGAHGMFAGTNDARWGAFNSDIRFQGTYFCNLIKLSDFEVIQLGWTPAGQLAVPIFDMSVGGWTTHLGSVINLYSTVDEDVVDDNDSIHSSVAPSDDTCILNLTALPTPADGTVTLSVRAKWGWGAVTVPFVWDAVAGATSYILKVGTTPMQTVGLLHDVDVGNVLNHDVVLPTGDTYYARTVVVGGAHGGELTAGGEQTVTV